MANPGPASFFEKNRLNLKKSPYFDPQKYDSAKRPSSRFGLAMAYIV
jgi:hypothetical protein